MTVSGPTPGAVDDPQAGFLQDPGSSDTLLVAFSGLSLRVAGLPPFEFFNLFSDVDIAKAFVRDIDQSFYQRGVRGLGSSIPEVVDQLGQFVAGHARVVFVGVSAGGYAALLLGAMLGVDHVVAMSPQTFLGRGLRFRHSDRRWPEKIHSAHHHAVSRKHLDVKPFVRGNRGVTHFHVYYPTGIVLDTRHARRLESIHGVEMRPTDSRKHGFVRDMRDDGSLKRLLIGFLDGEG